MDNAQIAGLMINFRENGDQESWEQLYNLAHEKVNEVLRCFHPPQAIGDCSNDFWLNLREWLEKFEYDPSQDPITWLLCGARYQAQRTLARREHVHDCMVYQYGVLPGGSGIDRGDGGEGEPVHEMIRQETAGLVRDAVASIKNPDLRYVAQEYYLEGRTMGEVCDEQDVPRGTGWRRAHAAREELRRKLHRCA